MSQARFQKMQREKARREKLAAKRERRAARAAEAAAADEGDEAADVGTGAHQPTVLAQLAALHEQFEEGAVEFDEFEDRKRELLAQLDV